MSAKDAASWDRYWAHGFLTSCADAFAGNYEGVMRTTWEAQFEKLRDGARVLDICTGNGAIALIAAAVARRHERRFAIDAIDLAVIDPDKAVDGEQRDLLEDIRFHAQTDAAATPFAAASFDFLAGHFALEYTDTARTVTELGRIAAAGATVFFVIHHRDSAILKTSREEQRHLALLDASGLFDRTRSFIEIVGNAAPAVRARLHSSPEAEQRRLALNESASKITAAIGETTHPEILRTALGYVSDAYRRVNEQGLDQALQRLDTGVIELAANELRLKDLTNAAFDKTAIGRLATLFSGHGFGPPEIDTLNDEQGLLIGWTFQAQRA